jgi:serine/threonine protein kinase
MPLPEIGEVLLGRYAVVERLGDGGTATVFRATDRELGRDVAIKAYAAPSGLSDSDRRRREARALAGLRHPAIVTLFDARLDEDPAFLVLEFVDGETLAHRLRSGALGAAEAREIVAAAAEGLAAAHAAGIVHRDVKPANLMLPADGDPAARLLDFGIAHSLGSDRMTTRGTVVGSAVYLSPEQARGDDVTDASDVYSLGLVLIECLTGRPAFAGTTPEVLHARLVRAPALDAPELAADAGLLARMTALEPSDRPSAAELVTRLREPAATLLLPASAADVPTERLAPAPGDADPPTPPRRGDPPASPAPPARPASGAAPAAGRQRRRPPVGMLAAGAGILLAAVVATALVTASGVPEPVPTAPVELTPTPTTPTPVEDPPGPPGNNGNGKDNGKDKKP